MRFPGLFQTLAAVACIVATTITHSDGFWFAAVMFAIGAAEARIMDVIRNPERPGRWLPKTVTIRQAAKASGR